MKTISIVLLCLLCAGCDSILLKGAMESRAVQSDVPETREAPGLDTDPRLLSITGERHEKYYRVIDYPVRDKMLPEISYPKRQAGYYYENYKDIYNTLPFYQTPTYNSLLIDPLSYADLYAGPPYMVHAQAEAAFGPWTFRVTNDNPDGSVTETTFSMNIPFSFNAVKPLLFDTDIIFEVLHEKYSVSDSFTENSLSLPATSDYNDDDYWEYQHKTISIPVTDSFLRAPPAYHPELQFDEKYILSMTCAIPDTFSFEIHEPFVHESRDFYEYKTITLKFSEGTKLRSHFNRWPIVKDYQWDSSASELTITLNAYETRFTGPVISYTVLDNNNNFVYQRTLIIE